MLSRIWSLCSTHTHHHTGSIWRWRMLPPLPWKLLLLWLPGATFPTNSWKNPRSSKLTKSQTVLLHFIIDPSSLPFPQTYLFPLLILSPNESNVLSSLILEICHCWFFLLIFIFFKSLTNSNSSASEIVLLPLSHTSQKWKISGMTFFFYYLSQQCCFLSSHETVLAFWQARAVDTQHNIFSCLFVWFVLL